MKEKGLSYIIIILITIILVLITNYSILPNYKKIIQEEAINTLTFVQARDRILFYPVIEVQSNKTIIQSITWQELCKGSN